MLSQWWGPRDFINEVEMDARPGGAFRIVMRGHGGAYPMTGTFTEVRGPEKIVMTMDVTEHPKEWHDLVKGNRASKSTADIAPITMTVTFEDAGAGKTKLTVVLTFVSEDERDAFLSIGMREGWSMSLERLEELMGRAK